MKSANSAECFSCMKCVKVCPKNSLSVNIGKKKITKPIFNRIVVFGFYILLTVIIFLPFWESKPASNIRMPDGTINIENLK